VKVVVIPVFNEEKSIFDIINKVFNHCDKIIVVNDCSTDGTKEILESINNDNLIIMTNEKNLGIGGATKVGIKKALEIGAEIIIKFDGDGQHSSNDIPEFINLIENENYDFIKGNRFKSSISQMPAVKILGNLISTNLQKIVTGNFSVSDPNNGFIAFKASIFDRIQFKYLRNDYFFENSLLLNLVIFKFQISEVPIKTIYGEEKSSIPIFIGSIKLIPVFLKLLYLKNYLNTRHNLSMGSLIFLLLNILIFIKILNNDLIDLNYIIICVVLYGLIEVINFLND
jgi:glycosyltransferase involved in cell wall biosynthesis|tara:strand:- start:1905 stop:2756 length:852 start_codon:yes stop_codon:yes gene_type:complete